MRQVPQCPRSCIPLRQRLANDKREKLRCQGSLLLGSARGGGAVSDQSYLTTREDACLALRDRARPALQMALPYSNYDPRLPRGREIVYIFCRPPLASSLLWDFHV